MRQLTSFELKPATLDLSDRGICSTQQLWANGQRLSNAINLVVWEVDAAQLEICDCGVIGCADGGWVSLRRSGDWVLMMPDWEAIASNPDLPGYYDPPYYLVKEQQGISYWHRADYQRWQDELPGTLPDLKTIAPLTAHEVLKAFQIEAPARVLGRLSDPPRLNPESIVAASEGSHLELLPQLQTTIKKWHNCDRPVTLRPIGPIDTVVQLYIDVAGFPEWSVFTDPDRLYLQPSFAIA